jgi:hypothetical protein
VGRLGNGLPRRRRARDRVDGTARESFSPGRRPPTGPLPTTRPLVTWPTCSPTRSRGSAVLFLAAIGGSRHGARARAFATLSRDHADAGRVLVHRTVFHATPRGLRVPTVSSRVGSSSPDWSSAASSPLRRRTEKVLRVVRRYSSPARAPPGLGVRLLSRMSSLARLRRSCPDRRGSRSPMSSSTICTALRAAPFRRLSQARNRLRPFSTV